MRENLQDQFDLVWLIARRELHDQLRDWRIIVPMVILTVFFPFLMTYTAKQALDFVASYGGGTLIPERLVPFLLMVVGFFPITVSLVIALESFVGEKERGTIEPLLSSPLKDWQIYLGKLLASSSVPIFTSYLGISVFLFWLKIDNIAIPDFNLIAQTVILTTVQGLLMVSGAIIISTQATSVRSANLLSSFIVIPIAILIQGESVLMFWGNNQILWMAVLGVSILGMLLVRVGMAHFQREALLGREIDILNIKWIIRKFWESF
jgi:ABC-type Na+ efflux pump permease subunit